LTVAPNLNPPWEEVTSSVAVLPGLNVPVAGLPANLENSNFFRMDEISVFGSFQMAEVRLEPGVECLKLLERMVAVSIPATRMH